MSWQRRWFSVWVVILSVSFCNAETPAAKKYPFAVPPLEIYQQLPKSGLEKVTPIPEVDVQLLTTFWKARHAGNHATISPADEAAVMLHLIAADVPVGKRAALIAKFNEVETAAKKAVKDAKTDRDRADWLLRFLHQGVLAKGYDEKMTTLNDIFEHHQYNCVSASAMYYLIGKRLGLKLQPLLIPGDRFQVGHAAIDLVDGQTRIAIEPTNPDGFDWLTKLQKPGVFVIGPQPDRKKAYDTDSFGLASATANNLGIHATTGATPRIADAIRLQAISLVLAPTDPTAITNLLATVSNWGLNAEKANQYHEAVTIYAYGRLVLGNEPGLDHNYRTVWKHYIRRVFDAGQLTDGLKLLPKAAAAFPKETQFADPVYWIIQAAIKMRDQKGYEASIALTNDSLKHLDDKLAAKLITWKAELRREWSQDLLRKGNIEGSLTVLNAGLKESPTEGHLLAGLSYHTQEALDVYHSKNDLKSKVSHFKQLCEQYPQNQDIRRVGYQHAERIVDRLATAKKFTEAMNSAKEHAGLVGSRNGDIESLVYDMWANYLAKEGQWEAALSKYADGIKQHPKNHLLNHNAIVMVDDWADKSMKQKDWPEAIRIYNVGLKFFVDNSHLKQNRDYCERQRMPTKN